MKESDMKDQMSPRYAGEARPKYIAPEIKYPSYQDFSNQGPASPEYSESRGYIEHR